MLRQAAIGARRWRGARLMTRGSSDSSGGDGSGGVPWWLVVGGGIVSGVGGVAIVRRMGKDEPVSEELRQRWDGLDKSEQQQQMRLWACRLPRAPVTQTGTRPHMRTQVGRLARLLCANASAACARRPTHKRRSNRSSWNSRSSRSTRSSSGGSARNGSAWLLWHRQRGRSAPPRDRGGRTCGSCCREQLLFNREREKSLHLA